MEDYEVFVPPCRFICEAARIGCLPFMRKLGFSWPEKFNCDSLPDRADGSNILCLDFNLPKRYIPETHHLPETVMEPVPIESPGKCCNNCQYPSFIEVLSPLASVEGRVRTKYLNLYRSEFECV